jgi:hypothetical protein
MNIVFALIKGGSERFLVWQAMECNVAAVAEDEPLLDTRSYTDS